MVWKNSLYEDKKNLRIYLVLKHTINIEKINKDSRNF